MYILRRIVLLTLVLVLASAAAARAQSQSNSSGAANDGWRVAVYPIFVWIPLSIDLTVDVPPEEGGGGGSIVDSRFDGAYFGGVSASRGRFRLDANGMWAGFGGDRIELPSLTVDVDAVYFHATAGVRAARDLYVTGGVRRLALGYDVTIAQRPTFERTPGIWDPIVGLAWHADATDKLELHATFDIGGFGVGTDIESSSAFRVDWKPVTHVGLTAGYNILYVKLTDELLGRTFVAKQTLHGPLVGVGLYF